MLATICQCCIDNAKRTFAIDIPNEIKRIKNELGIQQKKLPAFWKAIKREYVDSAKINEKIDCPMNVLYRLKVPKAETRTPVIPLSEFYNKYKSGNTYRKNVRVEKLIKQYELKVLKCKMTESEDKEQEILLLRLDFEELMEQLERVKLSKNYIGLCSWLIDRSFNLKYCHRKDKTLYRNRQTLLRVLYSSSPQNVLKIFSKMH